MVNSGTPVVVDFHAHWCGLWEIVGPKLGKMVAKQRGKEVLAKVDTDDNQTSPLSERWQLCLLCWP